MSKEKLFKEHVRRYFAFLEEEFGFKEIEPEKTILSYGLGVRYLLDKVFIQVDFIFRGSAVCVDFGRILHEGKEEKYSFHMFLGVFDPCLYYELGFSIAKSDSDVVELLEIYSKALKVDGVKILNNKGDIFKKMKEVNKTGIGLCPRYYEQPKATKIFSKFT